MPVETCSRNGIPGHRAGNKGFCFTGKGSEKKAADSGKAIAAHNKKGEAGKDTGAGARKAIEAAVKRGCTLEQIGKASNRSVSTIGEIRAGRIKNPPKELAGAIMKACAGLK